MDYNNEKKRIKFYEKHKLKDIRIIHSNEDNKVKTNNNTIRIQVNRIKSEKYKFVYIEIEFNK